MTNEEWTEVLEAIEVVFEWAKQNAFAVASSSEAHTLSKFLPRLRKCSVVEWQRATKDADLPLDDYDDINDYIIFDNLQGETQAGALGSIRKGDLFAPMPQPPTCITDRARGTVRSIWKTTRRPKG